MPSNEPVLVDGIWLRRDTGGKLEVLAQVDSTWRTVIEEQDNGVISHIVEPSGILSGEEPAWLTGS